MTVFHLPDLGEGLTEAEIVDWRVGVGDHVVADQPLVTVETEKAMVELPSPVAGRVTALHGAPGDLVRVGEALAEIDTGEAVDHGTVVGRIPQPASVDASRSERSAASPGAPGVGRTPLPAQTRGSLRVAPAVRAKAVRLGIDLGRVEGTGPDGAITSADLEGLATVRARPKSESAWEPLRGVRRTMARRMAAARDAVASATLHDVADVGHWLEHTSVMSRLIPGVVAGCAASPAMNAWYLDDRDERCCHDRIDLGVAMDTPDGLFVPVLRDAASRSEPELALELARLEREVHARKLAPSGFANPTISLSNFGMLGGLHASLVVVPPQVAIVGAGRIHEAVVASAGVPAVSRVLPLSISFDHRVVTGAEAARFMAALRAALES